MAPRPSQPALGGGAEPCGRAGPGRAAGRKMANVQLEFQANAGEADPQSRPLLVLGQLHNLHRLPWAQLRGKLQPRVSEEVRPERRSPAGRSPPAPAPPPRCPQFLPGRRIPDPALRGLGVRPESGPEGSEPPGARSGGGACSGRGREGACTGNPP